MPYDSVDSVPEYVPKAHRAQWREVFNSAYAAAIKDGLGKSEAEQKAFAEANGVAGPGTKVRKDALPEKDKIPHTGVGYEEVSTRPGQACGNCVHFLAPSGCEHVASPVAQPGWCVLFAEMSEGRKAMPTKELRKFIPFAKVDEARREVWGIVTAEVPDKDNEVCDYAGSKPYYEAVIAEMRKATNDGNYFPLREMHQLSAVGKGIGFDFRDSDREIYMGFKVADDRAWGKVVDQVYTGFSQGGSLVGELKPDPVFKGCMRYIANPSEVSLVDNPCLGAAHFAFIRADGALELRKFKRSEAGVFVPHTQFEELRGDVTAMRKALAYFVKGTVPASVAKAKTKRVAGEDLEASAFAYVGDPEKTSTWVFPIKFSTDEKTKRHIRNALARFESTKKVPAGEKAAVHAKIVAAAKEHGIDVAAEKVKHDGIREELRRMVRTRVNKLLREKRDVGPKLSFIDADLGKLRKGLCQVGDLAWVIESLACIINAAVWERDFEQDESTLPNELAESVDGLLDALVSMVAEESDEMRTELESRTASA